MQARIRMNALTRAFAVAFLCTALGFFTLCDIFGFSSQSGELAMALSVYDYTVLKSVRAVCPRCFAENPAFDPEYPTDFCDGHLVERDGAVYLRRWCRRGHGEVWSLYEEDAALWRYLQQWRVPTKIINPDTHDIFPAADGLRARPGARASRSIRASICSTSRRNAI